MVFDPSPRRADTASYSYRVSRKTPS